MGGRRFSSPTFVCLPEVEASLLFLSPDHFQIILDIILSSLDGWRLVLLDHGISGSCAKGCFPQECEEIMEKGLCPEAVGVLLGWSIQAAGEEKRIPPECFPGGI